MDESKPSECGERVENLAEPMEGVEGVSTSEDVMIEVLGSDVFVDGVRSHEDDEEIDAVVSEDDGPGDNSKTTDDMDVDSTLPNDSSEPLGGESKDLLKDVGSTEIEVHKGDKEIPGEEGGLVAETPIIVVEETQFIDDEVEGFVEETQVVDEKNLINETNDEVENPLEGDDDVSHRGKTEVFVETVVDASTGASTTPVQEQDGSESAAADTIVATVELDTPVTTNLVPNQEEEHENVNVDNGVEVECHPSLVLETPSSLGEDNLTPEGDSDDVNPILEESAPVMQSGDRQADVSVLEEEANTEEPSVELLAPVSVEGEVTKIKDDNEGSSGVAVSNEEIQTEDKSRVEDADCSIEEADDVGVLAADSEQPTQIVVAGKAEEVDEGTISSTCPAEGHVSKPEEGHIDSKMDDSIDDVEAASLTGQTTEANTEVVTGSSEKEEQTQEAIKPDEEEEEKKPPEEGSLKHNLRDITYPIKKGRSMEELLSTTTNTNDDDQRSTKEVMDATTAAPPVPKPSFKIGECMSRVASQLTGSSAVLKHKNADPEDAPERNTNEEKPSLHDLLSRLQVAAQEPLKENANVNGNSSFDVIRIFFSDFRNSAVLEKNPELAKKSGGSSGGSKRKRPSHLDDGSTEAFEFEDMNDSYWTDRVIENGVEEELLPSDGSGGVAITTVKRPENHTVPVELKPLKTGRRPYNKRRHLETSTTTTTNHGNNGGLGFGVQDKPDYIDPNAPAELVMIFSEFGFIPATEASLNRMFKRFGPLKESMTELDRDTCCARVVFKKCSDAEVACSSAGRFNIFGPVHVIYQLNYTVSPEIKTVSMIEDDSGHHEEDCIE